MALTLFFAGCGRLQSGTTTKTTLVSPTDTRSAQDSAPLTKSPEAPSAPAQPVAQNPQPSSEKKPSFAAAAKGAEKLVATSSKSPEKAVAASAPAPARTSEKTPLTAKPPDPKPHVAQDPGAVASLPVTELVFKGPPHEAPKPRVGMKALGWLGLGLGVAALAILARLLVVDRAKPTAVSAAGKDELKMPPDLLFKESVIAPEEPLAAEGP